MESELPPAPSCPVAADGTVAFGTYRGHTGVVDWSAVRREPGRRAGGWKRWHYVSIAGPDAVVAVAVVDLGWASSAFAYLFDRRRRRLAVDASRLGLPRRSAHVADRPSQEAVTSFRAPGARTHLARARGGSWRLTAEMGGFVLDAVLHESPETTTLCAIAPVPGGVADCTHKTPGLRVEGSACVGDTRVDLSGYFGAIDHSSGLLARDTEWRWASATGAGVSLNFTEGFTAPAENAVWVGARLQRVGPVRFEFDRARPLAPWHIGTDDGAVDLEFTPEGSRQESKNLVLAVSRYVQPIGVFRGRACGASIDGLVGVTEDHVARW